MIEYVFPGTVVLLKLAFRVAVGRSFAWLHVGRSLLAFPVDLSFLGLSFAAISMSQVKDIGTDLGIREVAAIFFACIISLVVQQVLSLSAENMLDQERYVSMGLLGTLGYILAGGVLLGTFAIGGAL